MREGTGVQQDYLQAIESNNYKQLQRLETYLKTTSARSPASLRSIREPWSAATWSGSAGGSEPQRHRVLEGGQRLDHLWSALPGALPLSPQQPGASGRSAGQQLTVKPSLRLKQGDEILLSIPRRAGDSAA